jgi:hypothetical protein
MLRAAERRRFENGRRRQRISNVSIRSSSTLQQKLGLCLTETSIDAASIVVTPTSHNVQLLSLKMLTRMMTRLAILPLRRI